MNTRMLAQPLKLKHIVLKNRIIMGSMHTGFEDHPQGNIPLAQFYAQRAKAGVSLIITGGVSPSENGVLIENGSILNSEKQIKWHEVITKKVHEFDSKICLQILHAGRYSTLPKPVAPSAIASIINSNNPPKALETSQIYDLINDYIKCALLAKESGYDGIEIMASEGYLINQFLAPVTNKRTDEFGGSLDNRQKLAVSIVQNIRKACGEKFLIIFRISLADLVENGSTWNETEILAKKIIPAGADLFNTGIGWHESKIPTIAICVPRASFIFLTEKLHNISTIPVIASNRINMPTIAEEILQKNQADIICMARPFLADPQWVKKAVNFQDNAINTCIACNQACLDNIFSGKLASCLVNPFACHETEYKIIKANTIKNIAVIGSGPAGLSFAINAAKRGHKITIFEANKEIGGQLNLAKIIPGKSEFHELIRYLNYELNTYNIEVKLNIKVHANDIKGFDEIVIATGIIPKKIHIEGINRNNVLNYLDILVSKRKIGNKIAIIGTGGIGFDTAEYILANDNHHEISTNEFLDKWEVDNVTFTTRGLLKKDKDNKPIIKNKKTIYLLQRKSGTIGNNLGKTTGWIHRLELKYAGVIMMNSVIYEKIDDQGLHIIKDNKKQVLNVDNIIICAGQEPNNSLAKECEQLKLKNIHIIGGAYNSKNLDAQLAIKEGMKLGISI